MTSSKKFVVCAIRGDSIHAAPVEGKAVMRVFFLSHVREEARSTFLQTYKNLLATQRLEFVAVEVLDQQWTIESFQVVFRK